MKPRLILLMNRAHRALKTALERETRRHLDLTSLEVTALFALSERDGLGVQELARMLYVDHAVVSRLSKQLVRKGMVRRAADPNDRRRSLLALEGAGAVRAGVGLQLLGRANARLLAGFTDDELAVVARFLEHIIDLGARDGLRVEPDGSTP